MTNRISRMTSLLQSSLNAHFLDIINESHMHNVPKDAETHLKVVIVSPEFEGVSLVKRHQKVQALLKDEMDSGLHALSIVAKTKAEWEKMQNVEPSPKCMGGFGK